MITRSRWTHLRFMDIFKVITRLPASLTGSEVDETFNSIVFLKELKQKQNFYLTEWIVNELGRHKKSLMAKTDL